MSQIAANGGQPQKQPKYAAIYTGRFFNGINTNRSPLRAASASHIAERFYSDSSGDALIAGSNLEVTNRLTLARRPGNPIYDQTHYSGGANGYHKPLAFGDFRVNKATSDSFGTILESIYTMVDQTTVLQSLSTALQRGGDGGYNSGLNFTKSAGAGQSFMQPVGNSLYFANGVDAKKWLTSLFTRTSTGNSVQLQGTDGLAGTYPFGTYLIDPTTGFVQQFIGISIGNVTAVKVAANTLTLTVSLTSPAAEPSFGPPSGTTTIKAGTSFVLWGMTTNTFLNGATVTLDIDYTYGVSTTFTAAFNHADLNTTAEGGAGYIVQAGTTPVIALTGSIVPTWSATVPSSGNNFTGGLTLDGNTVWVNRGAQVENWGIKAPTVAPTFNVQGQEEAWQSNTYYSPAAVYLDPNNNLWQITQAGKTGAIQPTWNPTPTHQQKVVISSVSITANVATFITDTQSPALVAGDTLVVKNLAVASFMNGATLTVLGSGLSTTGFKANFTHTGAYSAAVDYGYAVKAAGSTPPSTQSDGAAIWTCIQLAASLTWAAHTHYNQGDFIIATVGGVKQFFQLSEPSVPFITTTPALDYFIEPNSSQDSNWQGSVQFFNAADPNVFSPASSHTWGTGTFATPTSISVASLNITRVGGTTTPFICYAVNGAGELTGSSASLGIPNNPNHPSNGPTSWDGAFTCKVFIPRAGSYTFTFIHKDGGFFSFDTSTGATKLSGASTNVPQSMTAKMGYGTAASLCGNNNSGTWTDSATWNFPTAGEYGLEIDYADWFHSNGGMQFFCPGPNTSQNLPVGRDISGTTTPVFPTFTSVGAQYDVDNQVIIWGAKVNDTLLNKVYVWNNIGPVTDFVWQASTEYTLPGTSIIDSNANQEGAYETGVSGKTEPTWSTSAYTGITADSNPPLTYLNEGPVPGLTATGNTISATSAQGWLYWVALVNTLDNTVSNLSPVSTSTGPVVKGQITIPAGSGLNLTSIDPQADYVAIFRSADGFPTPLLIPGFVNSPYTVPLAQYLNNGYVDTVPDTELNTLVEGPLGLENTPPAGGAVNLTYHLNRIWYSIGNTVYWTSGPLSPVGNGDGTAPGNFAACPSQVKRLVPTAIGMLVFTQSDVFIIAGNGTSTSPILPAIPYLIGVGLGNHNALDVNGGLIGFFTTDKQFVVFDPSAGVNYVGFNIGDQFRLNNGGVGQSWDSTQVYVAWYVNGEDTGWYVADGQFGWYRMIYTPAPEQGSVTWSPFATIQGTCGAIASIETAPGVHQLLIGQTVANNGNILTRNLDATTDNGLTIFGGTPYIAYGVLGSIVLANPGQIAKIAHITTVSVKTGSPLILGLLINEALPYYSGSFDILKHWVSDPPGLPESRSFYRQRFYLAEDEDTSSYCMDLQILLQFPAEAAKNELQTLTIYGAYEVEQ
jgi:hypothetical protein